MTWIDMLAALLLAGGTVGLLAYLRAAEAVLEDPPGRHAATPEHCTAQGSSHGTYRHAA